MLLPVVVPDIPESRPDVVPARVARKIAPLLGVRWDGAPFAMTWVCDYASLSVSEIARGAPSPTRTEQQHAPDTSAAWSVVGRAVAGKRVGSGRPTALPNEIANATVTRFGPDTKAALVLTGANALYRPVTEAILDCAARPNDEPAHTGRIPAYRVAVWASLVLDAFRSSPALMTAALQARQVQRANILGWDLQHGQDLDGSDSERVVLAPGAPVDPRISPRRLDVLDETVAVVVRDADDPGAAELRAELCARLAERLRSLGQPDSDGYLWLSERTAGHRLVEAVVPFDPFVSDFVASVVVARPATFDADAAELPLIPTAGAVAALPVLTRRCIVLAVCTRLRLTFASGSPEPFHDLSTLAAFDALEALAADTLARDDPARAVVECRLADMRLEIMRQDVTYDEQVPASVAALTARIEHAFKLARAGTLGAGDAVDLALSGNVELLATLRRHRSDPIAGLPTVADLSESIRSLWRGAFTALGLAWPPSTDELGNQGLGFHAHNYATYLGREDDAALEAYGHRLFEEVVLPARRSYYERTANFRPLMHTLQNGAAAGLGLAERAVADHDRASADRYVRSAHAMITEAMGAPLTARLLDDATSGEASDEATRFALLAAPTLLSALESGTSPDPAIDVDAVERLLVVADRFAERIAKIGGGYARAGEITAAHDRLTAYRGSH